MYCFLSQSSSLPAIQIRHFAQLVLLLAASLRAPDIVLTGLGDETVDDIPRPSIEAGSRVRAIRESSGAWMCMVGHAPWTIGASGRWLRLDLWLLPLRRRPRGALAQGLRCGGEECVQPGRGCVAATRYDMAQFGERGNLPLHGRPPVDDVQPAHVRVLASICSSVRVPANCWSQRFYCHLR